MNKKELIIQHHILRNDNNPEGYYLIEIKPDPSLFNIMSKIINNEIERHNIYGAHLYEVYKILQTKIYNITEDNFNTIINDILKIVYEK